MKRITKKQKIEFLRESNAIEGVYDDVSLHQAEIAFDYLLKQKTMSTGVVLKLHKILMLHQNLQPNEKGYFRKCAVWIGGREGMNWVKIPEAMVAWVKLVNATLKVFPVDGTSRQMVLEAKFQHVEYERIHPFVDGNGRTGRMLLNWTLARAGLPIVTIRAGGQEQQDYYKWFK
jgi:Fic family protein